MAQADRERSFADSTGVHNILRSIIALVCKNVWHARNVCFCKSGTLGSSGGLVAVHTRSSGTALVSSSSVAVVVVVIEVVRVVVVVVVVVVIVVVVDLCRSSSGSGSRSSHTETKAKPLLKPLALLP